MNPISTIKLTILFALVLIPISESQHWSRGFNPLGKRSARSWYDGGKSKRSGQHQAYSNLEPEFSQHKVKLQKTREEERRIFDLLQMLGVMDKVEREVFREYLEEQLGIDFGPLENADLDIDEDNARLVDFKVENKKNTKSPTGRNKFMR